MTTNLTAEDRAELNRVWDDLTAAIRVIERLLGDDDPTGLRYSRDDDEPVAAPTREHFGFTVTGREQWPTNSPADLRGPQIPRSSLHGRPGSKLPAAGTPRGAAGMGAALLGGRAALAPRGGGLR